MTTYSSDFIKEIIARGFIHQATDINNLDKLLDGSHGVTGLGDNEELIL